MDVGIIGLTDVVEIGRGPHARVHRAEQPELGRTVAVKVYDAPWSDDVRRAVAQERQTLDRLSDHAGIVPVLGSGQTPNGDPYVVMPYFAEGSLARRLDPANPLAWPEAVGLMETVASTVGDVHRAGLTHGNLKPSNILLTDLLQPAVSDFAVAATGVAGLHSPYLAPEVRRGRSESGAADVFSLGAVLLALLSGRPPSVSPGIAPSSELPEGVPATIGSVIDQAMEEDPDLRPPSAAHFLLDLRGAASSAPAPATAEVAPVAMTELGPEAAIIDPLAPHPATTATPRDLGPLVMLSMAALVLIGFVAGAFLAFGRNGESAAGPDPQNPVDVTVEGSSQTATSTPATSAPPTLATSTSSDSIPSLSTTTTGPSATVAVAPQILTMAVEDITEDTARVTFTSSQCTGTRYQISGISRGDSGYPDSNECWNAHQLLLGREPFTSRKLEPDTEYTVTVVLVNIDGVESIERSITFRTRPRVEAVVAPVITNLVVSEVTATSARISFRTDQCTGSLYVVNGERHHNVGYPFGPECFNNHWAELGNPPYSPGPLTPATTYQVVVIAILEDGTESDPRQVAFTTAPLSVPSELPSTAPTTTPAAPAGSDPASTDPSPAETTPADTIPAETVAPPPTEPPPSAPGPESTEAAADQ